MRQHAFLVAACGLTLSAGLARAQLVNTSFEVPGSTTVFDGWTTFENVVPEFAISHTGIVALKVYGNGGGAYNAAGAFQDVPVIAGHSYEAGGWSMHSSTDPMLPSNFAVVNIEWLNSSGGQISFISAPATSATSATDNWTRAVISGTAPAGAVAARVVMLHIQGPELAAGAVIFDDASFREVTLSGLQNPGFENGFAGWNAFSNAFVDDSFVHTGTKAAKMFGCWCRPFNDAGVFQDLPAQPGENWQAKVWVGTKGSDRISGANFAVLNIEFRDSLNNLISFVSSPAADVNTPADQWTQITTSGIAPPGTVTARVVPLHIQPALDGGAVWWDDVEFAVVQGGCRADWNHDEGIDGDDVIAFFEQWDMSNADYNDDGGTDGDDVIAFFGDWDSQCGG